jgi:hypothetical protein
MYSIKGTPVLILVVISAALIFGSCKKANDRPATFSGYIKKENTYYRLDSAIVFYDSLSADKTLFSLQLYSKDASTNLIVFDYLLLQNTYALLPGAYPYQKLQSMQDLKVNHFHDIMLKCNSPLMSSSAYPVSQASVVISKSNSVYTVEGGFIMNGSRYDVHFTGPIQHIKSW